MSKDAVGTEYCVEVDGMVYVATLTGRDVVVEWNGGDSWIDGEWNGWEIRKCDARFGENVFQAIEAAILAAA